jgi:hypothetical protein
MIDSDSINMYKKETTMTKKTSKKTIATIADKLTKVNDNFNVYMYDNGFMFEISGRDSENEYKTAKIMCPTITELVALVQEASESDRDD